MKKLNLLGIAYSFLMAVMLSAVGFAVSTGAGVVLSFVGFGSTVLAMSGGLPSGALFTLVNPASITWNGKEVSAMAEATMVMTFKNPELTSIHLVVEDIVAKQQIVFLGILSKITKKKTSCGGSPTTKDIEMTEKFWEPERVSFWLEQCADDLEESFWVWALNKGLERKDLEQTDFAEFIMERISTALSEDMLRIAWFSHTDAANISDSPAGIITDGVDVDDYNIISGLWDQIYDIVAADSTKRITISHNAQATYANQAFTAADVTNKVAHGILQDMIDNADTRLTDAENSGLQFIVTKSIYNQYKKELKSYSAIEASFQMNIEGKKELTFDGIPVIPFSFWDRTIKADFDNGTKWYQPHRAVLTVKENIPIGVDSSAAAKEMKQFYLPKEETSNWKGGYKVDTKVLQPYMIITAY